MMTKYIWSKLTPLQMGRYAEYYSKMEFTKYGFDVYTSEVDEKGIDFIAKINEQYFDIQVKSARLTNYIFFPKDKFSLKSNLLASIVLFEDSFQPEIFLIPSIDWNNPNTLLVSHDYEGKKSKPEWGINISKKNIELLNHYKLDKTIQRLLKNNGV